MYYRQFKDLKLSALGLGNMRLPRKNPDKPEEGIDWPRAHEIMARAMEAGINYYDTAYVYGDGDSELCVGEGLKKFPRESFYIATKYNCRATKDYRMVFETQLKRLQTDYIDFYLLHCLQTDNVDYYTNGGAIEYFEEQRRLGRIKYLGFSTHAPFEILEKFTDRHKWDFVQIQLNYFDWVFGRAKQEYDLLTSKGIPVMVMEPVRGGRLAALSGEARELLLRTRPEWSIPSWALRFVRTLDNVCVTLSGMSDMDQLEDNIATFNDPHSLSEEEEKILFEALELYKKDIVVPCTGCRYCTPGCPAGIDIPAWMNIYNEYKIKGSGALSNAPASGSTPKDCISCGSCAQSCPQDIRIPQIMAELAKLL